MDEPECKRRKPNYFIPKGRKQYVLNTGLKGFLCSCNFREKECIRESYNLLNTYADILEKKAQRDGSNDTSKQNKSNSDDIGDELSNEINAYKNDKTKRFQVLESGAKNCIFISTSVDDPVELVCSIIRDVLSSRQQKTRYLLRLIPIEVTCKATLGEIKISILKLIQRYFTGEAKTFAVVFNHRNNDQMNKDEVIKEIAALITAKNSKHKVDLKNADLTVIIEVIRGICLMSIVPHYNRYKKYNLLQLSDSVNKK